MLLCRDGLQLLISDGRHVTQDCLGLPCVGTKDSLVLDETRVNCCGKLGLFNSRAKQIREDFREALLQVTQSRQPCWKLNERFGVRDIAAQVQQSGMTGWYYRVLVPGLLEPGQALRLAIPVARVRYDYQDAGEDQLTTAVDRFLSEHDV